MNILAIANNKGGVGKTTSAQNIGAAIATFSNSKVLIVDLDPQASLSNSFGIRLQATDPHVGHFLLGKISLEETIKTYKQSNIDILPASIGLIEEEDNLKKDRQFPFTLLRGLEKATKKYDFVVIDCPPMLSAFTKIALATCQRYYVPLQAEYFSYQGLKNFIYYANDIISINKKLELGGIFAIRFNPYIKNNFNKHIIQSIQDQLPDKLLKTYIRENVAISKSQAKGEHIFDYDTNSNGALDYHKLTKEIILR